MRKMNLFILFASCIWITIAKASAQDHGTIRANVTIILDSLQSAMNNNSYSIIKPFITDNFRIKRAGSGIDAKMMLMGVTGSEKNGIFLYQIKKIKQEGDSIHVIAKLMVATKSTKEDFYFFANASVLKIDRINGGVFDLLAAKDTTGNRTITVTIPKESIRRYLGINPDSFTATTVQVNRIVANDTINHINSAYQPEGRWSRTYNDGSFMCEGEYVNGLKEGFWHKKFQNGKLMYECFYHEGKRQGECRNYYPSGMLKDEGNYLNDLPDGIVKEYYADGKLKSEITYLKGVVVCPCVCYKANGHQKKCDL